MTSASFANWAPYTSYVQNGGSGPGIGDGKFLSATMVGMFAGPPRLSSLGGNLAVGAALSSPQSASQLVYPIGISQSFNLGQNKQWQRIFEIGSKRSYWIPGHTMGQIGLGRVLYDGASLLRVLYAYYQDLLPPTLVPAMFPNVGAGAMFNPHDVQLPPGYENFYVNLASDLFDQPIGLLIVMKNSNLQTYASFYLEACVIPNHSIGFDAQGVVIQEQCGLQYEWLVPIAAKSVELIS